MEFDTSIDLVSSQVADWIPSEDAVRWVREAVEALPGAGWVSVEWCGHAPHVRWIMTGAIAAIAPLLGEW